MIYLKISSIKKQIWNPLYNLYWLLKLEALQVTCKLHHQLTPCKAYKGSLEAILFYFF